MIGSLMYLVTCTRPDLAFTVSVLPEFSSHPLEIHHHAVKRVFRYLVGTNNLSLVYPRLSDQPGQTGQMRLIGFSDAAYGNCLDTRRSWSRYCFYLSNCLISWMSKKQILVATSTTDAEYVALSLASRQAMWYIQGFNEMDITIPIILRCDNTASIHIANNPIISPRTNHIDIHYYYIRERLIAKEFELQYIPTDDNTSDIFTKGLEAKKYAMFTIRLGLSSTTR